VAAGILIMDALWALGLFGLALASTSAGLAVHDALSPSSRALAIALALTCAVVCWILVCALTLFALPKPRAGKYRMMRGGAFYLWALGFVVRRWLDVPPFGVLYRQSGVLRYLVLRAAGARVAFTAQMSSDALVLDPALFTMGANAMLGSQTTVAGHFILGDRLVLAPVVISPGAQIAIDVVIGPGAVIGRNAVIEARASIGPEARVGDGAVIGGGVAMGRGVIVGERARIPMSSVIPAGSEIPAGGTWPLPPSTRTEP
jgi:hypothetical protein